MRTITGYTKDGLPRRRGGVSGSPPRIFGIRPVFPAGAGVFPLVDSVGIVRFSLPRRRGGVSVSGTLPVGLTLSSPQARGCF